MKKVAAFTLPLLAQVTLASDVDANPVAKVVSLLEGMEKKVNDEVAATEATFKEAKAFCEKRSSDLSYSIKTNKGEKEELEAVISKSAAKIETMSTAIDEAMQTIETNENDLKAATDVRTTEAADFKTEEKDLLDTMSNIEQAISVLERKAGSASLLQVEKAPNMLEAIDAMVSASVLNSQSASGLTALIQKAKSEDSDMQAPEVAAYEKKNSNTVVEMLEDLFSKAKDELTKLRKKEAEGAANFMMLSQSLNDGINFAKKDVEKSKATSNENAGIKADSEKQLTETVTSIKSDSTELEDLTLDCKRKATDYTAEQKDNADELEALGVAKKALVEKTSGASGQLYDLVQEGPSFLQVNTAVHSKSRTKAAQAEIVQILRRLAHKQDSKEISLLASRVGASLRSGGPFDKIVDMIKNMVAKMQKSLDEDTTKKAYCDAEMAKAKTKHEDKQAEVDKLGSKIDKASSSSAQLKSEVKELEAALTELAKTEQEMIEVRQSEKAAFEKAKPELEGGLEGVKIALKVLRKYYEGKDKGTGVIGMLEVCEEDFAKSLSERTVAEKTAVADFEKESNEMKLEKTRKEQDVKFKTEEAARIDKDLLELQGDSEAVNQEMEAVLKYKAGIEEECVEKKESFAEKAAKRQAEIDGLKEALNVLAANEAPAAAAAPEAFIQINRHGNLRLSRQ